MSDIFFGILKFFNNYSTHYIYVILDVHLKKITSFQMYQSLNNSFLQFLARSYTQSLYVTMFWTIKNFLIKEKL